MNPLHFGISSSALALLPSECMDFGNPGASLYLAFLNWKMDMIVPTMLLQELRKIVVVLVCSSLSSHLQCSFFECAELTWGLLGWLPPRPSAALLLGTPWPSPGAALHPARAAPGSSLSDPSKATSPPHCPAPSNTLSRVEWSSQNKWQIK